MSLTITCPVCGPRNGYEFRFGGEEKGPRPDQAALSPGDWCDYTHMNHSRMGVQREWWCHRSGCGKWFILSRDTLTNMEVSPARQEDTP